MWISSIQPTQSQSEPTSSLVLRVANIIEFSSHPTLSTHMCMLHTFTPPPPSHLTLLFVISRKRANIFPVFARLDPHLIKLAHYVALWLVEGNQLFNSQTWATGAGGAQRAAHLIPRTLISYKAKQELSLSHPTKLPHLVLWACRTLGAWRRKEVWVIEEERNEGNKKSNRRRSEGRHIRSVYAIVFERFSSPSWGHDVVRVRLICSYVD